MKKNGFVFIETIVTVVVLSASLLLLYNSYSSIFQNERERLYYDDVSYIYRTNYVKKYLYNYSNIQKFKKIAYSDIYIEVIGRETGGLFETEQSKIDFEQIISNFNISQIAIVSNKYIENCFNESENKCKDALQKLDWGITRYIRSLNDTSNAFYLVIEYAEKINQEKGTIEYCQVGRDKKCSTYFVNIPL